MVQIDSAKPSLTFADGSVDHMSVSSESERAFALNAWDYLDRNVLGLVDRSPDNTNCPNRVPLYRMLQQTTR